MLSEKFLFLFISAFLCAVSSQDFDIAAYILKNNQVEDCYRNSNEKKENGDELGRCVKVSECQLPTRDPATDFDSRENDDDEELNPIDPDKPCDAFKVCCPLSKIINQQTVQQPRPTGCGYSNPGGVAYRESDGKAGYAEYAEFPWMVALLLNKESRTKEEFKKLYLGGGTIIHPSVVLTVAHKLQNITSPTQIKCRAGVLNWADGNEIYKTQEREVAKTIIHPEFNSVNIRFDIALLILSTPFDVTADIPSIAVACLEPNLPEVHTECYSMGWGKDVLTGESNAATLKKITLPLVDRQICQTEFLKKSGESFSVHDTFICAGGEANVDTCVGDGGSSLVCPIQDREHTRYSVVGMVAYGAGCGEKNVPGLYTNVPFLYNWIVNKMKLEKIGSSSFKYRTNI